jgi:UDP-3-O-[3-hydroxymyristoyl] glucosamine N-acyltransferase
MSRPSHRAADLAERFALRLHGDGAVVLDGVATLANAGPGKLAFLANPRYRAQLAQTRAGAVVMRAADAEGYAGTALLADDPYAAFARLAAQFETRPVPEPGMHPSAVVAADAFVDPSAQVGPFVSIGARSRIEAGATIGPGCVIGEDCVVGEGCELVARVTLVKRVRLGKRVLAHPGAVLGADGFGLAMDAGRWLKVPQLGGVLVGDDCEIGANTSIDRGAIEDTVLEEDVRLDNQIQVGHNARIGRYCLIGGGAGVLGHLEVCDRVVVTAMSLVTHSIREPGEYSSGTPLMPNRAWRRSAARFKQLDRLFRRKDQDSDEDPT